MTEPIKKTSTAQPAQQTKAQQTQTQQAKTSKQQSQEPSIGRLLLNRAGAVIMTPIAGVAGVLTIMTGAANGAINPNKTFNQGMTEGIQAAGQGADMLDKMWQGKFF